MDETNDNINLDPLAKEINHLAQPANEINQEHHTLRGLTAVNPNQHEPSGCTFPQTDADLSVQQDNQQNQTATTVPCQSSQSEANLSSQNQHMKHFITCASCGKQYSPKAVACPACGEPNQKKVCQDCGALCSRRAIACPKCGAPFESNSSIDKTKNINDGNKSDNIVNVVVGNTAAAAGPHGVITGNAVAPATSNGAYTATANSYAVSSPQPYNTCQGTHNKWVAFMLCFFWGYLGAHRFYEGKIATGILYFFTLGL